MPRYLDEAAGFDFIKGYLFYTYPQESPEIYHVWTAISAISSVLRRSVWKEHPHWNCYPNLYITLVSPPGVGKKSTAMRIGRGLFNDFENIKSAPDSLSCARMMKAMGQSWKDEMSAYTVHSSEFGSLFSVSAAEMLIFLTNIFDSQRVYEHQTENGVSARIEAPYLTLLSATTPQSLALTVPHESAGIGLFSRIIFVFSDTPRVRDADEEMTPEQLEMGLRLKADLEHIMLTVKGKYVFEGAEDKGKPDLPDGTRASKLWREWYRERPDKKTLTDPRLASYLDRKPTHVEKVAMCIAASRRDSLIITERDLIDSFNLFEITEAKMKNVFGGFGKNPLAIDMGDVAKALVSTDEGIGLGELLERFSHTVTSKELSEVLTTLATMGKVVYRDGRYFAIRKSQ